MPKDDLLGVFEQLVLLALLRLGDEAYGVTVREELQQRTGRSASLGAVYATLDRLEQKGYLSSRVGDPTAKRGGRARRYFRVENAGRRALQKSLDTVEKMRSGLTLGGRRPEPTS